ncbi:MAG: hypothetical protein L0Y76_09690, partial [Ignavibacteria bacterium]|nr:hypothetical protein [Ignavibacteria bacterium]
MLDKKLIRENPNFVEEKLKLRGENLKKFDLIKYFNIYYIEYLQDVEKIREQNNILSKEIGRVKKLANAQDDVQYLDQLIREIDTRLTESYKIQNAIKTAVDKFHNEGHTYLTTLNLDTAYQQAQETTKKWEEVIKEIKPFIKQTEDNLKNIDNNIDNLLYYIPALPADGVPFGKSADDNVEVKVWGEKKNFDFKIKDHVELSKNLDILDFERGAKISGSGFPLYKGRGATLERALINFMLDTHLTKGYREVMTPVLVNRASMEAA